MLKKIFIFCMLFEVSLFCMNNDETASISDGLPEANDFVFVNDQTQKQIEELRNGLQLLKDQAQNNAKNEQLEKMNKELQDKIEMQAQKLALCEKALSELQDKNNPKQLQEVASEDNASAGCWSSFLSLFTCCRAKNNEKQLV